MKHYAFLETRAGLSVYALRCPPGERDSLGRVFVDLGERICGAHVETDIGMWMPVTGLFTDKRAALERAACRAVELARVYSDQCTEFLDEKRKLRGAPVLENPTRFERDPQV